MTFSADERRYLSELHQLLGLVCSELVNEGTIELGTGMSKKLVRAYELAASLEKAQSRPESETFSAYLRRTGITWTDHLKKN